VRVEIVAGPLEGKSREVTRKPPDMIWIVAEGLRFFRTPPPGKFGLLHRRSPRWHWPGTPADHAYICIEHSHRWCEGCEEVVPRSGCPTCKQKESAA
jgi:hypothetical protein